MSCFKKIPCRYTIASLYIIDIFFGLFLCGIPQKYLITANLHINFIRQPLTLFCVNIGDLVLHSITFM
jgi:hypothetical protein